MKRMRKKWFSWFAESSCSAANDRQCHLMTVINSAGQLCLWRQGHWKCKYNSPQSWLFLSSFRWLSFLNGNGRLQTNFTFDGKWHWSASCDRQIVQLNTVALYEEQWPYWSILTMNLNGTHSCYDDDNAWRVLPLIIPWLRFCCWWLFPQMLNHCLKVLY